MRSELSITHETRQPHRQNRPNHDRDLVWPANVACTMSEHSLQMFAAGELTIALTSAFVFRQNEHRGR